jgi:hypothetical protein
MEIGCSSAVAVSAAVVMLTVAPAFGRGPASRTCPPFIYAHRIKTTNIGCRAADSALRRGRFTCNPRQLADNEPAFLTPGWVCHRLHGRRPFADYGCRRDSGSFSFTA